MSKNQCTGVFTHFKKSLKLNLLVVKFEYENELVTQEIVFHLKHFVKAVLFANISLKFLISCAQFHYLF